MRVEDRLFIGGSLTAPSSSETLTVISPYTEEPIATVPEGQKADIDAAVAAARKAFDEGPWPRMSPQERGDMLAAVADAFRRRSQELAQVITDEVGSPISTSLMLQAPAPVIILDYYANLARTSSFEERRPGMAGEVLVRREPVGVVGAIVPWNVPMILVMAKLAPALAAGCTMVLKPAPETPLHAYFLADVLTEVGLPPGVVNIVAADRPVSEYLVTHPGVDKISFTGSTLAGRRIASLCGEQLKRVTVEAGGKSAAILLDDVDLRTVVPALLPAAMLMNGEACIAQTRILAPRERYTEVVDALCHGVETLRVGDPSDEKTQIGPLFAERQRERVEGYIAVGREEGARVAIGGGRPRDQAHGWFVEPTVFTEVSNSMRIAQEEIFGPVIAVIPYDGVEDAVTIANDSIYGLSGTVWSSDADKALDVGRRIRTGTMTINGFRVEFKAPFGGFKQSGLGREFGPEGLEHYLELQTISLPV